jgi:hypothetical protein
MTTVLETTAAPSVSFPLSAMQDIPLVYIHEKKTNSRRQFDETKLAELAAFVPRNKISVLWPNPLCGVRTEPFALADWRLRQTFVLPYVCLTPTAQLRSCL